MYELGTGIAGLELGEFVRQELVDNFGMASVEVPKELIETIKSIWVPTA